MGTLKEALYDNLLGTLSDNTNRRNQAEQQIKLLEVVNGKLAFFFVAFLKSLKFNKNCSNLTINPIRLWPLFN